MVETTGLFDLDCFLDNISVCSKDGDRRYERVTRNIKLAKDMVAKASQVGKVKYLNKWKLIDTENELEKLTKDHIKLIEEHLPLQQNYQQSQEELSKLKEKYINTDLQLEGLRHHSNQLQALVKELEEKLEAASIEKQLMNSSSCKKENSKIKLMKHIVLFGKIAANKGKLGAGQRTLLNKYICEIGDPTDTVDTDITDLDNIEMPLSCGSIDTGVGSSHSSGDEKICSPEYHFTEPIVSKEVLKSSDSDSEIPLEQYKLNGQSNIMKTPPKNVVTRSSPRKSPRMSPIKKHMATSPHKLWLEITKSPSKKSCGKKYNNTKCNVATSPIKKFTSITDNQSTIKCNVATSPIPPQKDSCIFKCVNNNKRRETIECDNEIDNILKEMTLQAEHISPIPPTPINLRMAYRRKIMKRKIKRSRIFNITGEVRKLQLQNLKLNKELCRQRKQMLTANKILLNSHKKMLNTRKLDEVDVSKISHFIGILKKQFEANSRPKSSVDVHNKFTNGVAKSPKRTPNCTKFDMFSESNSTLKYSGGKTCKNSENDSDINKSTDSAKHEKINADKKDYKKMSQSEINEKRMKVVQLFGEDEEEETDNEIPTPPKRVLRSRVNNPDIVKKQSSLSDDSGTDDMIPPNKIDKPNSPLAFKNLIVKTNDILQKKHNVNAPYTRLAARNSSFAEKLLNCHDFSSSNIFKKIENKDCDENLNIIKSFKTKKLNSDIQKFDSDVSFTTSPTRVLRKRKSNNIELEENNGVKITKQAENTTNLSTNVNLNQCFTRKLRVSAISKKETNSNQLASKSENIIAKTVGVIDEINSRNKVTKIITGTEKGKDYKENSESSARASIENKLNSESVYNKFNVSNCIKTKQKRIPIAAKIIRKTRNSLVYECNKQENKILSDDNNTVNGILSNEDGPLERLCVNNQRTEINQFSDLISNKDFESKSNVSKAKVFNLGLDSYPMNNPVGRLRIQHKRKEINPQPLSGDIKSNGLPTGVSEKLQIQENQLVRKESKNTHKKINQQPQCSYRESNKMATGVSDKLQVEDNQLVENKLKNSLVTSNKTKTRTSKKKLCETDNEELEICDKINTKNTFNDITTKSKNENGCCGNTFKNDFFKSMLSKYGRFTKRKTTPTNMPEAAVKKIENVLENYLGSITEVPTCKELDSLISQLEIEPPKMFVAALLAFLMSDNRSRDILCKKIAVRVPSMTKQEQALLYILSELNKKWSNFSVLDAVMKYIEYKILRLGVTPELTQVENLSRFYAVICRFRHMKDTLRMFMVEALYCLNYKSIPVIKQCLDVWMHVIPLSHLAQASSPIVTVLVYVIFFFKVDDKKSNTMVDVLKRILSTKYSFNMKNVTEKDILQKLSSFVADIRVNSCEKKALSIAFILLAKRKGVRWCQKHIVEGILMPFVNDAGAKESVREFCISLLGSLLKPYPDHMKLHCEMTMNKLLVMMEENPSSVVEQATLFSLLLLRKHNIARVMKILTSWNPKGEVCPELKEQIKIVIQEHPLKQWVANLNGKAGDDFEKK